MKRFYQKTLTLAIILAVATSSSGTTYNKNSFPNKMTGNLTVKAATPSINASPLGPVTPKDTIYQIITDRFYNGNTANDMPSGTDPNEFDGTDSNLDKYQGGDFQGIINKIPYLKSLGITAVWISPPNENREGLYGGAYAAYHGYHADNYFVTNKHFGSMLDFAQLRDSLHSNGIKLIIDFASNHSNQPDPANGSDGKIYEPLKDANGNYIFDSTTGEPTGRNLLADPLNDSAGIFHHNGNRADNQTTYFDYEYRDLASLADFSQENPTSIKYLDKAYLFWKQKGIDGFRDDATLHQNSAFLAGVSDLVNSDSTGPVTQFGEYFIGRPDSKYGQYITFPQRTGINDLDFEFYQSATTTFGNYSKPMSDFANMLVYTSSDYKNPEQAVTFIDNHDVQRFGNLQWDEGIFDMGIVALMTSRGTPNIYYGTEDHFKGKGTDGNSGRVFMQAESSFATNTPAFNVISKLASLRKSNDAIAFGSTTILYSDNDVMVEKRQYGNKVVIVAMNRSTTNATTINQNLSTSMPTGTYSDYLAGALGGKSVTVSSGTIASGTLTLQPKEVDVWQYNPSDTTPRIGTVISTRGRVGNQVYIYGENFDSTTTVSFNGVQASVQSVSSDTIKAIVPSVAAGNEPITVTKGGVTSNAVDYFVLSGDQVQTIFHASVTTNMGDNIYVVGDIPELGAWDVNKAIKLTEAMMCPNYPQWFLPVSVPANTSFQFKFVKKDSNGNIYWETGSNRTFTSTSNVDGSSDTPTYNVTF